MCVEYSERHTHHVSFSNLSNLSKLMNHGQRPPLHIGRSPGDVPRRSPKKVKNYTLCGNWKNFRCYRLIWTRWRRCYPQKRSQKARTCLKLIFVFTAKNTHKHEISILSMFLTFESVSVCSIVSSASKLVGSNGKFFQFPQRVQFLLFWEISGGRLREISRCAKEAVRD